MKEKVVNIEGDYVEFEREYGGKLIAKIHGRTAVKRNRVATHVHFTFGCLSGIMNNLKKTWEQERVNELAKIERIDRAVGRA